MSTFTADTLAEPVSVSFTTPLLSVSSISVSSAIAAAATDGAWSSPVPEDEPNYDMPLHEIPADALMPVTLSADVDPQKFADAVELVGASGIISRESNTSSCGWLGRSSSRCVVLKIQELAPGSIATLRLKPNAAYSASEIQSVSVNGFDIARVTGIVPFKFRFRTARGSNPGMLDHTPQYRRYSLFIRHGMVGDAGAFAQSMKFVPNVADISFKLQGKTRLIIEGKFEPSTSYSLGISASATIKDGFGMPLEGSQLMFTTAKLPDYFQYVDRTVQFTSSFTSNMGAWMLGTSKVSGYYGRDASLAPPQSIEFYGVTDRNIQQVIAQTYNGRDMLLGKADAVITADAGVQYPTFSAASVVSPSGLTLWVGHQHRNSLRHGLVTASDLSASFISSSDGSVTVFVWDTETLKPLASPAEVRFYQLSKTYRVQVSDVVAVSRKVTSSTDSVTFSAAELKRSPNSQQLVAVVKHGSKLQIFKPHLRYVPQDGQMASPKVTMITDRGVYKPGDTIHVKGWIREIRGSAVSVPDFSGLSSQSAARPLAPETPTRGTPYISAYLGSERSMSSVDIDRTFGSFNGTLVVPADARFSQQSVQFELAGRLSFIISDFRLLFQTFVCYSDFRWLFPDFRYYFRLSLFQTFVCYFRLSFIVSQKHKRKSWCS
jgi:hypothetical protein